MGIKSIIRKNVPNYSQASVIAADLIRFRDGDNPGATLSWTGNSYSGRRMGRFGNDLPETYDLIHWDTTIASICMTDKGLTVWYFDARYLSATTRKFQGRILEALDKIGVYGTRATLSELSEPTGKRRIVGYDDQTGTHVIY